MAVAILGRACADDLASNNSSLKAAHHALSAYDSTACAKCGVKSPHLERIDEISLIYKYCTQCRIAYLESNNPAGYDPTKRVKATPYTPPAPDKAISREEQITSLASWELTNPPQTKDKPACEMCAIL